MKNFKRFILLMLMTLCLYSCKDTGDEVIDVPGEKDETGQSESNADENGSDREIKLTEEQMRQNHVDIQLNDKITVSAYLTPYEDYSEGVNIYQAVNNKGVFENDFETIVSELSNQTGKSFTQDLANEEDKIYSYKSDDGMTIFCGRNNFSYTNHNLSGEIAYYGFGVSHKNSQCQNVAVEELLYSDKIKAIAELTKMNFYDKAGVYNYNTITADKHIYENYVLSVKEAGINLDINEGDGYEYAVMYPIIDKLPYKYQGAIYKKASYENYNNQMFLSDPYANSAIISTEFVNMLKVCYNNEVLTDVTVNNDSICGEKLSVENVIDANNVLQVVLKKLEHSTDNILVTSMELCYDVKLYIHDGILDGKYYPYWIVNYYDYSKEFNEKYTTTENPAKKIVIDAVSGKIVDTTRCNLEVEE